MPAATSGNSRNPRYGVNRAGRVDPVMIDYRKARPMLADLLAGLLHTVAGLLPLVGGLIG